jgi:hypothetical protein
VAACSKLCLYMLYIQRYLASNATINFRIEAGAGELS